MAVSEKERQGERVEEWAKDHYPVLYYWALQRTRSKELSEDLVQETFLAALERKGSFKGAAAARSWLFSILRNKLIDHQRRRSPRPVEGDDDPLDRVDARAADVGTPKDGSRYTFPRDAQEGSRELLDRTDFLDRFDHCLERLSKRSRRILVGTYYEGKGAQELCREHGISSSNYWQILHRARRKLWRLLKDQVGDEVLLQGGGT